MQPPGPVLLVHWNAVEAEAHARRLRDEGWEVAVESRSGADAFGYAKATHPAAVVVFATLLPSHGIETARALRAYARTSRIPIVFVGLPGAPPRVDDSVKPDALCTTDDDLAAVLAQTPEFRS